LNTANAFDATNSSQSTSAMIAGSFVFMGKTLDSDFYVALARALDFSLPPETGFSLPLSVDARRSYLTHHAYLAGGTRESREREMALLVKAQLALGMKMIESPRTFPLRTLMLCFTFWLIATEVLVFDQIKFDTRTQLLEQAARPLRGPEVIVPNERPSHVPNGAKIHTL